MRLHSPQMDTPCSQGQVNSVFVRSGRRIGKTLTLWSADSSSFWHRLFKSESDGIKTFDSGSNEVVKSVAFTPDRGILLSAGTDGSIRIWDKATGHLLTTSMAFEGDSWLTVTPEGFFDASSPKAAEGVSVVRGLAFCATDAGTHPQLYPRSEMRSDEARRRCNTDRLRR